ncbi:MAG: hypothetical protein KAH57_09650 [Thermoplasmata archaeon]|nr:hypothetical protein [Thermoplasmata archaeon]
MRLMNYPIGVPFETIHWNRIPIPRVISRHILLGGRDSKTPRKGGSELELALKYYDPNSRRSIDRFLGAIDKLVEEKKLKKLSEGRVIAMLHMLMLEDDPSLVLSTTSTIIHILHVDRTGTFTRKFMKKDGGMIVSAPLFGPDDRKGRTRGNQIRRDTLDMVRANTLYILGCALDHLNVKDFVVPPILDKIVELTRDKHEGVRGNAVFCLRMMLEKDSDMLEHIPNCMSLLMKAIFDPIDHVQAEGLRAFCFLLEEDLILDENIYLVHVPLFEEMSRSLHGEVARVAEQILYEIGKREELEPNCDI